MRSANPRRPHRRQPVRFVSGHLRRHGGGGLELEPTAVVVGSSVVVPAFAEATGTSVSATAPVPTDPIAAALHDAIETSADLLHRGHRHLQPSWMHRARRSAAGETLATLADTVRFGGNELVDRWADAHLRLRVTTEQL